MGIGIVVLFAYYTLRERWSSRAVRGQSHHPPIVQRGIRLLVDAAVVFLILQAFGIVRMPLPLGVWGKSIGTSFGSVLFWFGAFVLLWARETIGHNWAHGADYQVVPGQDLVRHGPYRFVRHPIYSALLLIFTGAELAFDSWLVLLTLPLYGLLSWQAEREEVLLGQAFPEYTEYTRTTGRLFPNIGRG